MFDVYLDNARQWRWRFLARNGRVIADSAESYRNKADCEHAIQILKREASTAAVR